MVDGAHLINGDDGCVVERTKKTREVVKSRNQISLALCTDSTEGLASIRPHLVRPRPLLLLLLSSHFNTERI